MDYSKICEQVLTVAEKAKNYIEAEEAKLESKDVNFKAKNDLVTYVDVETEKLLINELGKIVPEASFLAEETHQKYKEEEFSWIIDPVDGTVNFIHQIPVYSVSIALMENGKLKVGVVLEINRNEYFYAYEGGGAYLNQKPISVSSTTALKDAMLATGFPFNEPAWVDQYIHILRETILNSRGVRRMGSAAVDLCYTAAGRFDGYYEFNLKPWDVAAGSLIVNEAGGQVMDFEGKTDFLFGRQILAGNPNVSNELLEYLKNN
jgi:myo-inositol-1(or 4)-monophosphatase